VNTNFHPDAEQELNDAIDFYESKEFGLGIDFAIEIKKAIERIESYPQSWTILDGEIRRALLNRFPYGILYAVNDSEIIILAIMHLRRNPKYWKNRIIE
jgi:plasmid stabilization system protein ParE